MKLTKAQVSYGPGKPDEHCGICIHFRRPSSCTIVEGDIDWRDWCRKFVAGRGMRRQE